MTPDSQLQMAAALTTALPITLALVLYRIGVAQRRCLRIPIAIILPWALSIALTADVYNVAGITAGYTRGAHFPEARYDNNTIACQVLSGWFNPALAVGVTAIARRILRSRRLPS